MDDEAKDIRQALQEIHFFSDVLSAEQLDQLAQDCRPSFFRAGSILMRQGDLGASMFCIVEGAVSITYVGPERQKNAIRQLGAGMVVGEIELLTGERRLATVTAVTDVRALEIGRAALEAILAEAPELTDNFSAILAIRQELLQQIIARRGHSLMARILGLFHRIFGRSL